MIDIPYVSESDVLRWADSRAKLSVRLGSAIAAGQVREGHTIASKIGNDICAAAVSYVQEDMEYARANFNAALETFKLFFSPRFSGQFEKSNVLVRCEAVLLSALIVRHETIKVLAMQIAKVFDDPDWDEYPFIQLLAALIGGDRVLGTKLARDFLNNERATFVYGPGVGEALLAICEADHERFYAELKKVVREYDERARDDAFGTPEAAMFMRGAALLRLYELVNGESVITPDLDVRLLPGV